jgi:hypothetical protein
MTKAAITAPDTEKAYSLHLMESEMQALIGLIDDELSAGTPGTHMREVLLRSIESKLNDTLLP